MTSGKAIKCIAPCAGCHQRKGFLLPEAFFSEKGQRIKETYGSCRGKREPFYDAGLVSQKIKAHPRIGNPPQDDVFCERLFFALAHIMLIVFFISRALKEKLYSLSGYSSRSGSAQFVLAFILTVIAMGLLAFSTAVFAPAAPDITVRSAVSAYSAIILIMLWTALAQKDLAFAAAAVLFVFSDAVLAWNRYVSPVPGETYIVMIPYYIAQLTLFIRSSIQPQVYRQA